MGRILKKGERGIAASYMSRKQALKKLQLSLKDFRRLCILKGIYPVEPHHKRKANKNNSTNKTYYYVKDVHFLANEPLIDKFREFKVFIRRLKKAIGKQDSEARDRLNNNHPIFKLDHLVKERYPTFVDAVRDLDDAISMSFLFSTFPKDQRIKPELTALCRRLTVEFLHYIVEAKALRKVFISIKGIYYQAEIMGQQVTWIVPHTFGYNRPSNVDFKIMVTFAQFWSTMLGFINYKLYHSLNLVYPPKLAIDCPSSEELLKGEDSSVELIAALNHSLRASVANNPEEEVTIDEFHDQDKESKDWADQEESLKKLMNLFVGCKVFLNREVPKESLLFVLKCFGAEVSFDKTISVGATFDESDVTITHHIIDRPLGDKQYLNRYYIQPQWVYDCVNARMLLPVDLYFPGQVLPPHLSPFVQEKEGDYVPPEKQMLADFQSGKTNSLRRKEELSDEESSEEEEDSDEEDIKPAKRTKRKAEDTLPEPIKMKVTTGVAIPENKQYKKQQEEAEEKRLAIMAMDKKSKHLYKKIIYGQKRKKREVNILKQKREKYEKEQKSKKKSLKA